MALPPTQFICTRRGSRVWLQDCARFHSTVFQEGAATEGLPPFPLTLFSKSASCFRFVVRLNGGCFEVLFFGNKTLAEAQAHLKVYERLHALGSRVFPGSSQDVLVPEIKATIAKTLEQEPHEPFDAFMMGRVHSLPKHIVRSFITRSTNKAVGRRILSSSRWEYMDLVLRLGEMQPPEDRDNPSVETRPVYFDVLRAENPRYPAVYCSYIGAALALLHWGLHVDGDGVLLHMGSSEDNRSTPRLWMTNFVSCMPFEPSLQAVQTRLPWVIADSPGWPRPPLVASLQNHQDYRATMNSIHNAWQIFSTVYRQVSRRILEETGCLDEFGRLPLQFLISLCSVHMWDDFKRCRELHRARRIKATRVDSTDPNTLAGY